jgi:hypothetical protein
MPSIQEWLEGTVANRSHRADTMRIMQRFWTSSEDVDRYHYWPDELGVRGVFDANGRKLSLWRR